MTDPTRPALEALRNEFLRAASMYPALYHQLLFDERVPTAEAWSAFAAANSSRDWQAWHGPVEGEDLDWYGRFYGDGKGLPEFKQLADSLYLVIRQLDPDWNPEGDECGWSREVGVRHGGFEQCLDLLHRVGAIWPTPLIWSQECRWGLGEEHKRKRQAIGAELSDNDELSDEESERLDELDALEQSTATNEQGIVYPLHPFVETLHTNLFSAFPSLIEIILDKEKAFFVSPIHMCEPEIPTLEMESEEETPSQPQEPQSAEADHLLAFERGGWHLRFRWGDNPDEIEECWPKANKDMRYLAHIFARPNEWLPCKEVLPPPPPKTSRSVVSQDESQQRFNDDRASRSSVKETDHFEHRDAMRAGIWSLAAAIKQADLEGKDQEAATLRDKLQRLKKEYNATYDKFGQPRKKLTSSDYQHANRVRSAVIRLRQMFSPRGVHPLPNFFQHLKYITVDQGNCYYMLKHDWRWVVLPPKS